MVYVQTDLEVQLQATGKQTLLYLKFRCSTVLLRGEHQRLNRVKTNKQKELMKFEAYFQRFSKIMTP